MKNKIKVILLCALALMAVMLITSCSGGPPYEEYDGDGYKVTVRYDANGGYLTDGVSVITDTYALDSLPTKNGKKIAKLISPDDTSVRGTVNKFVPTKQGYTCVGWYATRTEVLDESGNVTSYNYSDRWDFKNGRLEIDPNGSYTSSEPYLTLYAAWVPNFICEFYSIDDPTKVIGTYVCDINSGGNILMPTWDENDNSLFMGNIPKIEGSTFISAYLDQAGTKKITGESFKHTGTINFENATAVNPVMKVYIESWQGEWRYVYKANQLIRDFDRAGNYIIMKDLDFKYRNELLERDEYYPWDVYCINSEFTGKIVGMPQEGGRAVKIKNIKFTQELTSDVFGMGLFGKLGSSAVIENIAFENTVMTINSGVNSVANMSFGLLAGRIDDKATLTNVSISGVIEISAKCTFKDINQVTIGLVCGGGNRHGVDYSNVQCIEIDESDRFQIQVEGDTVELFIEDVQ